MVSFLDKLNAFSPDLEMEGQISVYKPKADYNEPDSSFDVMFAVEIFVLIARKYPEK